MSANLSDGARRHFDRLVEAHPEWRAWLTLVAETLLSIADPAWDQIGLETDDQRLASSPLLAGASVTLPHGLADAWVRDLFDQASLSGDLALAPLGAIADDEELDAEALLETALRQDTAGLGVGAAALGVDADALAPIAQLATTPLLHACRRQRAAQMPSDWAEGCCPVCGGWPTVAETRGLDRARRLRCGRCGGDWGMVAFRCAFCGNADHAGLGSLVSETEGETRKVETCGVCRGYLKNVTTLRAWAPDEVALADLATVELDLAALDRGYTRPPAPVLDLRLRSVSVAPLVAVGDGSEVRS